MSQLSLLPGVASVLQKGFVSSLHQRNRQNAINAIQTHSARATAPLFQILFDPQTSGGLLASVPPDHVEACLSALHQLGHHHSRNIGKVTASTNGRPSITISAL